MKLFIPNELFLGEERLTSKQLFVLVFISEAMINYNNVTLDCLEVSIDELHKKLNAIEGVRYGKKTLVTDLLYITMERALLQCEEVAIDHSCRMFRNHLLNIEDYLEYLETKSLKLYYSMNTIAFIPKEYDIPDYKVVKEQLVKLARPYYTSVLTKDFMYMSDKEFLFFLMINGWHNRQKSEGYCNSIDNIAEVIQCSKNTVTKITKSMVDKGIITYKTGDRLGDDYKRSANTYWITPRFRHWQETELVTKHEELYNKLYYNTFTSDEEKAEDAMLMEGK